MKYRVWETSASLLIAYEFLALGYKKSKSIRTPLVFDENNELKKTEHPSTTTQITINLWPC